MSECRFIVYEGDAKRRTFCLTHRSEEGAEAVVHLAACCSIGKAELEGRLVKQQLNAENEWARAVQVCNEQIRALEAALAEATRDSVPRSRYDVACSQYNDAVAEKMRGLDKYKEHITTLESSLSRAEVGMRALESLTPVGSEYVGDVERCVAFVREAGHQQHRAIVKFKGERDRAEATVGRMREALGAAVAWNKAERWRENLPAPWGPAAETALTEAQREE